MKIGDLEYTLRADGAQLKRDVEKEAEKAGSGFAARFSRGIKGLGQGIKEGLGIGLGVGAIAGTAAAVGKLVDVLGDARKAYQEDQVSQAQLDRALKNNIAGWDGNRDAIEKVISARMKLGFGDEEQRASLALLVGATKDANKALEIQGAAMDLARLKGIDLATATDILIKAYAGQYRGLKSVGIQLGKNATFTDALAAITKVAGGQAEDFAKTSLGKEQAASIRAGEAMERLGGVIDKVASVALPLVADALEFVTDGLGAMGDAVGMAINQWGKFLSGPLASFGQWVRDLPPQFRGSFGVLGQILDAIPTKAASTFKGLPRNLSAEIDATRNAAGDLGDAIEEPLTEKSSTAKRVVLGAIDAIVSRVKTARDELTSTGKEAADAIYAPMIAQAQLAATERELADQEAIASSRAYTQAEIDEAEKRAKTDAERVAVSKMHTADEIRDAQDRIIELRKTRIEQLAELASYGDQAAADMLRTEIDVLARTKTLTTEQLQWLAKLRSALAAATAQSRLLNAALDRGESVGPMGLKGVVSRAAGGPIPIGTPAFVGEAGIEFLDWRNGVPYITPLQKTPALPSWMGSGAPALAASVAGSGAAAGDVYNIDLNLPTTARPDPFEVAREMRRLAELGVLTVRSR